MTFENNYDPRLATIIILILEDSYDPYTDKHKGEFKNFRVLVGPQDSINAIKSAFDEKVKGSFEVVLREHAFIRKFSNKTLKTKTNVGPIIYFRSKVKMTKNAKTAHNILICYLGAKTAKTQKVLFRNKTDCAMIEDDWDTVVDSYDLAPLDPDGTKNRIKMTLLRLGERENN